MAAAIAVPIAAAALIGSLVALRRSRRQPGAWLDTPKGHDASDVAARLLGAVIRMLPAERADWGLAMLTELQQIDDASQRRRFALGCALTTMRLVPDRHSDRPTARAVLVLATLCVGLVGYGLLRYPGIVTGAGTWLAVAAFLAVLLAYTTVAAVIALRSKGAHSSALGAALAGALVITCSWVLVAVAATHSSWAAGAVLIPTAVLGAPVAVGAAGRRRATSRGTGWQEAVLLPAIFAGLSLFIVAAGDTLLTGGRPYDSGQLRDFKASGMSDMATYAVNDNLGTAMMLLLMVPLLVTCLASLGARIPVRRRG